MIVLKVEPDAHPVLSTATLIYNVVRDMLYQNGFRFAHFDEIVELAVVGVGLGLPQSSIQFVKHSGTFWDSTQWEIAPRPFLDCQSLAYAHALTAWIRGEKKPEWANGLRGDVQAPMKQTLKYLFKTNDSFFGSSVKDQEIANRSQKYWWKLTRSDLPSSSIIALRQLKAAPVDEQQWDTLRHCLRSNNRAVVLQVLEALDRLNISDKSVADELKQLVEDRDDEICAKAMIVTARLRQIDDAAVDVAVQMLNRNQRHVVFAGVSALATLDSIHERDLPIFDRAFVRALQTCDYDFVGMFAACYGRWLENPMEYVRELLQADSPEYLTLAMDAIQNLPAQVIALK